MNHTKSHCLPILAVVLLLIAAVPASATFPGKNGLIAFIAGPDVYTMNPDGSNVKQLTNLGPDNSAFWESWSPNGKEIVFSEYPAPDFVGQLWLMNADGSNRHLLLAEKDFDDERASFTPDGNSVVFARCRLDIEACAIHQIGVAGGGLRAITDFDLGIQDLSPEYSSSGHLAFTAIARKGILSAIYVESPGEGVPRQLTPAPLTLRQPDWSPDGRRIAVASHYGTPQNEEIWVVDNDGGRLRQLTDNGNDYFNGPHDFQPSWSPQGDAIVFVRQAPDFSSHAIYMMRFDGTGCRKLLELHGPPRSNHRRPNGLQGRAASVIRSRNLTQIEEGGAVPQWGVASNEPVVCFAVIDTSSWRKLAMLEHHRTRRLVFVTLLVAIGAIGGTTTRAADRGKNGKIAFFANLTGVVQIYTINPDGTGLFQVTDLPQSGDPFGLAPDFSPDGQEIVFPHDMTCALELYVVNADGTGLTQITHDDTFHAVPHWSPDGTHIVFATDGALGPAVIATIAADGSDRKELTTPYWDSLGAEYTQDGKHIVFISQMDGLVAALWIMDTDGKHPRRLTEPEVEAGAPDVSPDGKHVVFYNHQNTPKPTSIFSMNLDGTGLTPLTGSGHMDTLPVYSPDGTKILYMSDRLSPGSFDTFIMSADGSNKQRLIIGAFAPNWGPKPRD